jgi:hypothetical protein
MSQTGVWGTGSRSNARKKVSFLGRAMEKFWQGKNGIIAPHAKDNPNTSQGYVNNKRNT